MRSNATALMSIEWPRPENAAWSYRLVINGEAPYAYQTDVLLPVKDNAVAGNFIEGRQGFTTVSSFDLTFNSSLHRTFADLVSDRGRLDQSKAIEFAVRFGFLGAQQVRIVRTDYDSPLPPRESDLSTIFGEARDFWEYHAGKVGALIALYKALRSESPKEGFECLAARCPKVEKEWLLSWPKGCATSSSPFNMTGMRDFCESWHSVIPYNLRHEICLEREDWDETSPEPSVDHLATLSKKEAEIFIESSVNFELHLHAYPKLSIGRPGIRIQARSLLGAIYLLLGMEISGQTHPFGRCPCGQWFEIINLKQIYCNSSCVEKASRRKKARNSRSREVA